MNNLFKITNNDQQIQLSVGIYNVFVIGGWHIKLNNFSVILRETNSGSVVEMKKSFWQVQSYSGKRRAKRIGTFDISLEANYNLEFNKPNELLVKKSNLMLVSSFFSYVATDAIQIEIKK